MNIIFLGGFNGSTEDSFMNGFCENYDLISLIKTKCFKNPDNPSCIDLILTKKPRSFIETGVIETGLSDCYKLVAKVIRKHFPKSNQASLLIEVTNGLIIKSLWKT